MIHATLAQETRDFISRLQQENALTPMQNVRFFTELERVINQGKSNALDEMMAEVDED